MQCMSDDNSSKSRTRGDQQKRVTRLFQSTVSGWEEVYERKDLYSLIYQRRRSVVLSLVDRAALIPGSVVLEVGCGPGVTTAVLAQKGYKVHAMDIVLDMVRVALKKASEKGVVANVIASVGDARHLAFGDGRFDLVVVVGVTEWMDSLSEFLEEITRVLKPGGHLVITSDNAWSLHLLPDPLTNPLLGPLKRIMRPIRDTLVSREPRPKTYAYSVKAFDVHMRRVGLVKMEGRTVGFGPFTVFRRKLLPSSFAFDLDSALQALADKNLPLLRSAGHVYVVLARKPG